MRVSKRTAEKRHFDARVNARRAAENAVTYGHGTLEEAWLAWKFFREGFPSLSPFITCAEWMRVYRSHPQWEAIRRAELRARDEKKSV